MFRYSRSLYRFSAGSRKWAGLLLALVLLLASGYPASSQGTDSPPALRMSAPQQAQVGDEIEILLQVSGAQDLAGFETSLLFDTLAAEFGGLRQRENDLKRMGRDVVPLVTAGLPNGVAFGLSSCPVGDCRDLGGRQTRQGGRGDLALATVILFPRSPGLLEVKLDATKFVDSSGNPLEVALANPSITIQVDPSSEMSTASGAQDYPAPASMWSLAAGALGEPGPFDLTGDGVVNQADLMEVALEWELARLGASPCEAIQDPSRDINHDGCIDVADLQLVAANLSLNRTVLPFRNLQAEDDTAALTFTVTSAGDQDDASVGDGQCQTASGACTLRAAIREANNHPGPDRIAFNIPGGGVKTIKLNGRLPTLNDVSGPTTIDGYTQPGSSPSTHARAANATILVQIEGKGSSAFDALPITSSGNVIRGLAIYNIRKALWIYGSGATENVVTGSFLGTNAAGTFHFNSWSPAQSFGVQIEQGASNNRIGGPAPAERNVLSGSGRHGVGLYHEGTDHNIVQNNIMGLTPLGGNRLPNQGHGADINFGAQYNLIGGEEPGEHNVASGNLLSGMEISHTSGTSFNEITGNYIGTDLTGAASPTYTYNFHAGVSLKDRVKDNLIAGNIIGNNRRGGIRIDEYGSCCMGANTIQNNRIGISLNGASIPNRLYGIGITAGNAVIGPGNIIANNPTGIQIMGAGSDSNTITRNSIYNNDALGIDLDPGGVTNENDADDGDNGPNQQLNFPVLESADTSEVTGTACPRCLVEIFISEGGEGAYGEGVSYVGSGESNDSGEFTANISGVAAGSYVTATATDPDGNTSEFSLNIVVVQAPDDPVIIPTPIPTPNPTPIPGPGGSGNDLWLPLISAP